MSDVGAHSLADAMKRGGQQAKSAAGTAMRGLAEAADALEMRETAGRLRATEQQLQSDTFNIIVMGRFKNGKSTLLNALMGGTSKPVELEGHKGPMVVDDLPATATLTGVRYAEEPYVKAWRFDGKSETWTLSRYLRESTLDIDEVESQRRFGDIREFEMGYPARLCQAGVIVYDSPGLDEHQSRTAVTRAATKRCDAAVVVYRSDQLMGQTELMDASALVAEGTRLFTVVNLWGARKADDRLRGYVWNKYVRDHLGGPAWAKQDLTARDIYFVNAALGRDGRFDGDAAAVDESGLTDFEQRLAEFLLRERQEVHLRKFVTLAANLGATIEAHITQRRQAAQTDQVRLREAYALAMPKLEAIQARPAKLPQIFRRYRAEAESLLTTSFTELVAQIRRELPDHLEATPLPSGEKFAKVFQQKKLQEEAARLISDFVTVRIERWSNDEANSLLEPVLERLGDEIESEIATIGRQFDEIHVELGWNAPGVAAPVVGTSERVLSAVASLLVGDIAGVLGGGVGGWRGAAGSIGGLFGTAFVLGALGLAGSVVFFPVVLAGAIVLGVIGGGVSLERRIKNKASEQTDQVLAGMPDEIRPKITDKINDIFGQMESVVTKEISDVNDEEVRHIRESVELNQREQADRDLVVTKLNETASAVAGHRAAIQRSLTIARQAL
jgi:hypothetical protein